MNTITYGIKLGEAVLAEIWTERSLEECKAIIESFKPEEVL